MHPWLPTLDCPLWTSRHVAVPWLFRERSHSTASSPRCPQGPRHGGRAVFTGHRVTCAGRAGQVAALSLARRSLRRNRPLRTERRLHLGGSSAGASWFRLAFRTGPAETAKAPRRAIDVVILLRGAAVLVLHRPSPAPASPGTVHLVNFGTYSARTRPADLARSFPTSPSSWLAYSSWCRGKGGTRAVAGRVPPEDACAAAATTWTATGQGECRHADGSLRWMANRPAPPAVELRMSSSGPRMVRGGAPTGGAGALQRRSHLARGKRGRPCGSDDVLTRAARSSAGRARESC